MSAAASTPPSPPPQASGRPFTAAPDGHAHTPQPHIAPAGHRHLHLWHLPDGTGVHAPIGQLVHDEETGEVCCHLCGGFFSSLGSHLRAHGWTAETYRLAMGLSRNRPLAARTLSAAISARQSRRYAEDAELQVHFRTGQAMARSGVLAQRAREARPDDTPEARRIRADALQRGRETVRGRRQAALAGCVADQGSGSLGAYLRDAYVAGTSLADLARATGLGRQRLREAMDEAGIPIRRSGDTTPVGRRARAGAADARAADRLGVPDLCAWLAAQRAAGATLTALAQAVGHSTHWVRWRLERADDQTG